MDVAKDTQSEVSPEEERRRKRAARQAQVQAPSGGGKGLIGRLIESQKKGLIGKLIESQKRMAEGHRQLLATIVQAHVELMRTSAETAADFFAGLGPCSSRGPSSPAGPVATSEGVVSQPTPARPQPPPAGPQPPPTTAPQPAPGSPGPAAPSQPAPPIAPGGVLTTGTPTAATPPAPASEPARVEPQPPKTTAPKILGVGTDKGLWYRNDLTSAWVQVPNSGSVTGIAVMPDGKLLGIGTDQNLWYRDTLDGPWQHVPNSGSVIAIAVEPSGRIIGVGTDQGLWTRDSLTANWSQVPNSGRVTSITILPDGKILGVGTDQQLWYRTSLTSAWSQVPNSGSVIGIAALPDGKIVGIGTDKELWVRNDLNSAWTHIPQSGSVIAIAYGGAANVGKLSTAPGGVLTTGTPTAGTPPTPAPAPAGVEFLAGSFGRSPEGGPGWTLAGGSGAREFVQRVAFARRFAGPPQVTVGLSLLDALQGANTRVYIEARNVGEEGFDLVFKTWADSRLYGVGANWLALAPARVEFLAGSFGRSLEGGPGWTLAGGSGEREFVQRVTFARRFARPPQVTVGLSLLDALQGTNTRARAEARNIGEEGFDLVLKTWADTRLYGLGANWLALEPARTDTP